MLEDIKQLIERFGIVDEGEIVSDADLIEKEEVILDGGSLWNRYGKP